MLKFIEYLKKNINLVKYRFLIKIHKILKIEKV